MTIFKGKIRKEQLRGEIQEHSKPNAKMSQARTLPDVIISPIQKYTGKWIKGTFGSSGGTLLGGGISFNGAVNTLICLYRFLAAKTRQITRHEARAASAPAIEIEASGTIESGSEAAIAAQTAKEITVNQPVKASVSAKLIAYFRAAVVYVERLFAPHNAKLISAKGAVAKYGEKMRVDNPYKVVAAGSAIVESRNNRFTCESEAAGCATTSFDLAICNEIKDGTKAVACAAGTAAVNVQVMPKVEHYAKISFAYVVEFCDYDGRFLYEKIISHGADCYDPVASGEISAPVGGMDVQYIYSNFQGWSLTPSGKADESALSNITKPTILYAAYEKELRYYTISFYDDDSTTLLHSASVAYGDTPSYVPTKDGYDFVEWTPNPVPVTGEASYFASWEKAKITFAAGTWAQIAAISESGQAKDYFALGDTKTIKYTNTDGTTTDMEVVIIGFDHDDLADGSGKAGITMACLSDNLPQTTYGYKYGYIGSQWYSGSDLYANSNVRKLLNGEIQTALPTDMVSVLKAVTKKVDFIANATAAAHTRIATVNDYLFTFTLKEVGINVSTQIKNGSMLDLGEKYSYFNYTRTASNYPKPWVNAWYREHRHMNYGACPIYGTVYSTNYGCYGMVKISSSADDTISKRVKFGFCV